MLWYTTLLAIMFAPTEENTFIHSTHCHIFFFINGYHNDNFSHSSNRNIFTFLLFKALYVLKLDFNSFSGFKQLTSCSTLVWITTLLQAVVLEVFFTRRDMHFIQVICTSVLTVLLKLLLNKLLLFFKYFSSELAFPVSCVF